VKKESNARTYAIWITIFGLIFAVILIFVIPKADYYQAFNNIDAVRQIYLTKDSSQRTIEDYTNLIYSLSGLTTENQDKITINNNLTQSMFLSNDFKRPFFSPSSNTNEFPTKRSSIGVKTRFR